MLTWIVISLLCACAMAACPTQISEGCPPNANCSASVCGPTASCPAWQNQTQTNCCSYLCGTGTAAPATCFAKWFDNVGNALNCDVCAGAQCQNRTQIEAACASQYGQFGYDLIQPNSTARRCCLTCQPKPWTCPTIISEGCPPSANCSSTVCGSGAKCPAWDGQRLTHCCPYSCTSGCFAKWFDNSANALNCDPCAGASCQNRTQIEAACASQYGANGYDLIQPDSNARRCCLTCQAKPRGFTCPTQISEGCPPSSSCASNVCNANNATCAAWQGQTTTNCCAYSCANGCFAKWFDNSSNALNCDPCAGAQCQNRTQIEAGCAADYGANGYDLIQPDSSKRRCCLTCQAKPRGFTCPTQISEGCPPSSSCASNVCKANATCAAWQGQTTTNCCAYSCANGCFAKWFDNSSNALNCDPCAGASCQNRTQIEAACASQYGANGYELIQPDSSKRRCCLTCQAKSRVFTCPTQIAENCPPSSSCASNVCNANNATCAAWQGQTTTNCCAYSCANGCFAKWFDNSSNALNCDVCAGAQCQNRTQIEAGCAADYGANGYDLIQPDSSKRRCCLTCQAKVATPYSCPTVIAEGCAPASNCSSSVCGKEARCAAWDGQTATHCCAYSCNNQCFAKWFDTPGNVLNCDVCAGAQCQNRTQVDAGCASEYGPGKYELVPPDASKRRCCISCVALSVDTTTTAATTTTVASGPSDTTDSGAGETSAGGEATTSGGGDIIEKSGQAPTTVDSDKDVNGATMRQVSAALIFVGALFFF
jgi:hypothetical protein